MKSKILFSWTHSKVHVVLVNMDIIFMMPLSVLWHKAHDMGGDPSGTLLPHLFLPSLAAGGHIYFGLFFGVDVMFICVVTFTSNNDGHVSIIHPTTNIVLLILVLYILIL
jgi:hypothetical protein